MLGSLQYISAAPMFFETMTFITLSAMFIGATTYNGDLKQLYKGLITIIPYVALLILVNVVRISGNVVINNQAQAYAGTMSVLVVTFFYVVGLILGVESVKFAHNKPKKLTI